MRSVCFLLASVLLIGCGGGSDTSSTSPPPTPAPTPPTTGNATPIITSGGIQVYGKTEITLGESSGFAILHETDSNIRVSWQRTSGPDVELLASNSQNLGFTPQAVGTYQFIASIEVAGRNVDIPVDFTVTDGNKPFTIMLDHAASELDSVSFHAFNNANMEITSYQWNQTAGPEIADIEQQGDFIFFDAPEVTRDSLVMFEVEAQFSDGTSDVETVQLVINNIDYDRSGLFFENNFFITEDMHAYNDNSVFKEAIENCVYDNRVPSTPTCDFNRLPLIGMQATNPTVQDILDRTLVSHQWMGDRFKQFLESSSAADDMLKLLRGVTAVVISYEVRPSFYWAATGAIYLDANNFWGTPAERDTLNDRPDFRSNFGDDLNFQYFWRYTKNNQYYPAGRYPKTERTERTFADIEASISWLMYHELAHANDFFPPSDWNRIRRDTTPLAYFRSSGADSDGLDNTFPLTSTQMHELAAVRYGGETASTQQKNYSTDDVAAFFRPDIAPSFYAYFTIREDYATLFERFMMLHRLNAGADIAFLDATNNENYIVTWGQRNRISEPSLAARTSYVVSRVYPELGNPTPLINALPAPQVFPDGGRWFETLNLSPSTARLNKARPSKDEINYRLQSDRKPQHEHVRVRTLDQAPVLTEE